VNKVAQELDPSSTAEMFLSDLQVGDLKQVLPIERKSFTTPWSAGGFRLALRNPDVMALKISKNDQLLGYLIAFRQSRELLIANIAVHEDYRGIGLGSWLLTECMERAREEGITYAVLDVRESNKVAQSLYRKLGFRVFGRRAGYYHNPREDALVMGVGLKRRNDGP